MDSLVLIAPPAGGKGTQSEMISKKYNIPQISTGDLLRIEKNKDTEIAKEINELLKQGILINDDIVLELVKNRIQLSDCDNGYILDGFPRTLNQAIEYDKMLEDLGKKLGHVILLEIDPLLCKKRIAGRVSCPNCKAIYNTMLDNIKPLQEGVCDHCHTSLVKREDDTEEVYDNRYNIYLKETTPLIDYYEAKGILKRVNALEKDSTFDSICSILGD